MSAGLAADAVLVVHALFVLFVVAGGFLVLRWPWLALAHLPAALWGAAIEFTGGVCPLTPLEQQLRRSAGEAGYTGGFLEQYLLPLIYPPGLTPGIQYTLGIAVIIVNAVFYALLLGRLRRR